MSDLSKEQEQAIARSAMSGRGGADDLMVFVAGLFLNAELEQQAQLKAEASLQISPT